MSKADEDDTAAALRRLAEDGSDMSRPMSIDFMIAVPTKAAGEILASKVATLGFAASIEQDEETTEWTCYCTKALIPNYDDVVAIEEQLDTIARSVGGFADGFGSLGNATEH